VDVATLEAAIGPLGGSGEVAVAIWTTTPWTLPANQAASVNPELDYVVVQCQLAGPRQRLSLAEALLPPSLAPRAVPEPPVVARSRASCCNIPSTTARCRCCSGTMSPPRPAPAACTLPRITAWTTSWWRASTVSAPSTTSTTTAPTGTVSSCSPATTSTGWTKKSSPC